ncbi:TonB-linked SusC/RagA family outer membrane protein [Pedobacter psychrotolerans]|uniref:TonB-linked SusC/RagA family outer membrane protein n=2 Tax=Pedobacter psychrotolerans TaxID=1843235 RepID=A0A4R2HDX0_9SPHI|nr:TonB-dependent receptor [Pedobacter psychrotolerans]TCO25033.1 TonB-linked SusC/RagA family outer membrane protein [Pedobacter psychrotolerans]
MKRNLLKFLLFFMVLLVTKVSAQERTVTGVVTSKDDGLPIPGVSVKVVNSKLGVSTGADGTYSIRVGAASAVLQFSSIGYATQHIPAGRSMKINVSLISDANALTDVVVIGYGTAKRKDVTGSVASIKGEDLAGKPVASFDQALAGKITGVQVTNSSGILGAAPRIRIRGTNSISSGADPLYVVDGMVIMSSGSSSVASINPLGDINPNDIQSVDVLKDGAATAIYGSRGANGVIIITTKKGVKGKTQVNYNSWFASANVAKRFDLLNAQEFVTIANEKLFNAGTTTPQAVLANDASGNVIDTDWQDLVFNKNAFQQNHNISFSGATDVSNYYFSLGYADLKGTTVGNNQTKYQFSGKFEQKALNNYLTFGASLTGSYVKNTGLNSGTSSLSGNIGNAIRALPNVGAFNADGSYNLSSDNARLGKGANLKEIDDNYTNIKYVLDHNIFSNQTFTLLGNAFADIKIIDGLNLRSQISTQNVFGEDYQYLDPLHGDGGSATKGYEFQQYIPRFRYSWTNTATYNKVIGDHSFGATVGIEYQKSKDRSFYASGSQLSSTFFSGENIISNSLTQSTYGIGGGVTENAYKSYFARANYAFKDRYLVSGTYRIDAISSLPLGNQSAKLPGVSVGWRVSQEDFFKDNVKFINDLKIRGGYAKTGNTDIGNYPFAGTFGAATYGVQSGLAYTQVGNSSLKFETSGKYDVGIDATMFDSRITLTADYFKNNVDNLILAAPTAPSLGVPGNSINQNVGKMYNKGYEFAISADIFRDSPFKWNASFNITFVKNKITQLSNNNSDITYTYNVNRVGESIGSLYGYEYAGVNAANGNPLYVKANGQVIQGNIANQTYYNYDPANPTALTTATTLAASDKKILGQSNPTYYGGLVNNFSYKGFDLNINMVFSGGNKVMNITRQESLLNQKFLNNGTEILERWTTPGQVTSVPKLYYGRDAFTNLTSSASSRFVEDGKFIRAQDIILGYSFPKLFTDKIKLNRLRIYAQVQNAFVITPYSGLDPELNYSTTTNSQAGLDYNTNPKARTFLVGLNVGF